MFIGHFGIAMAAKRAAPRTSLGTLVMAALFVDLLWPIFLLVGLERVMIAPGNTVVTPLDFYSYPISHSLLGAFGWSCLFAGIYKLVTHYSRGAVVLWFVVFSHWFLDALAHQPDLPLYPGSEIYVGLGLWNSRLGTLVVEIALFTLGARLYSRGTVARDWVGAFAFRTYVASILLIYFVSVFGPPPPSEKAVAYAGLSMWLLVAWAYWIDRHRTRRLPPVPPSLAREVIITPPPQAALFPEEPPQP